MGLLDTDYATANGKKPKNSNRQLPAGMNNPEIRGLLSAFNDNLRSLIGVGNADASYAMRNLDGMAGGDLQQARQANNVQMAQKMVDLGLNFNPAAIGQTVWHGSPHKFDKFDMSKIGTGEGAQAYGHGLYMAESDGLANTYRRKLTGTDGAPVAHPDQSLQVAIGRLQDQVNQLEKSGDANAPAMIKAYKNRIAELDGNGALYKADIPDEAVARFLDWDKPLSQQHPDVQKSLQSMTNDVLNGGFDLSRSPRNLARAFDTSAEEAAIKQVQDKYGLTNSGGSWFDKNGNPVAQDSVSKFVNKQIGKGYDSAGDLYSDLTHVIGDQAGVSAALRNNNIPGIRYLDGGSRGTGAGTSNFVLFDDQMPRILEVNGKPTGLSPWQPGEYGLLNRE